MMNTRIVATCVFSCAVLFAFSQHSYTETYCKHEDPTMIADMVDGDQTLIDQMASDHAALEQITQQYIASGDADNRGSNFVIPVVFHIIHNGGPENISDAQVRDAVRVLNVDFNLMNSDTASVITQFKHLVADIGITFRLAQKDPDGNCTNGITRIQSLLTAQGDQDMKDLIQWPRNHYLNVWVCLDAGGAAGYTYRPGSVSGAQWSDRDGIVMRYDYTGSIEASSPGRSRTLTHEVGHWLNLKHVWGGTNTPAVTSNCNEDDNVSDTPNTIGWQSCLLTATSCGSLDNVQNYMEYSYCSRMFTTGQKARMLAALNSGIAQRNQLIQSSNLVNTGTDNASGLVLCAADFEADLEIICAGDSILFADVSYNGVSARSWTFQGGQPATSTDSSVWVMFDTPGSYDVTLQATDGTNTETEMRTDFITVLPSNGVADPFTEDFESTAAVPNNDWLALDNNNDGAWEFTNTAGAWSSKSVRLENTSSHVGSVDELHSTTIDLSNASSLSVSFRYAYARRNASNDDVLRLYVSKDCGKTWFLRKQLRGSTSLPTGSNTNSVYVPGPNDWGYAVTTGFTSDFYVSDFRLKFEFKSDGGNYVYLDDINVYGSPVGIDDLASDAGIGLSVFPSPVSDNAQVDLQLLTAGEYQIELFSVTGTSLGIVGAGKGLAGSNLIPLDTGALAQGVYLIRATHDGAVRTIRFIKE